MRRALLAAVFSLLALASPAGAAGLDQTCELTTTRFDADTVNVLFPNSSAQYWTASYRAVPGTHIRIDGIYPYARYTSWNAYDPNWTPWGPQPRGTLIYRHMLPAAGFSGAIQRASYGTEPSSMGGYYPSARYSTAPSSFCSKQKP